MTTTQRDVRGRNTNNREDTENDSLRQNKVKELLLIPEVDRALDELIEIREEYWNALLTALIISSDEDRSEFETVVSEYFPRLKRHADAVAALVRTHAE